MYYQPINKHAKKSQVLVIHCADPRFQKAYREFIDARDAYFDLLVMPGASKAVNESKDVLSSIKLLHDFHKFEEIWLLNHVNCGAFGEVKDEILAHKNSLKSASQTLKKHLPQIKVSGFLFGEESAATIV